eukprot:NODE_152_length_15391_cov_0.883272.p9 type:complete len:229 gc:universal NODE_152_length_15391_cov_0.883272:1420-734(-)
MLSILLAIYAMYTSNAVNVNNPLNQITIMFDLDFTLIRTVSFEVCGSALTDEMLNELNENAKERSSHVFAINEFIVEIRPYARELLQFTKQLGFKVGIFTAANREYADDIIRYLDPSNDLFDPNKDLFDVKYYRESCTNIGDVDIPKFQKDLSIVDDNVDNVLLIDDNPDSFVEGQNSIKVKSFIWTEKEENDDVLNRVETLIKIIANNLKSGKSIAETLPNLNPLTD